MGALAMAFPVAGADQHEVARRPPGVVGQHPHVAPVGNQQVVGAVAVLVGHDLGVVEVEQPDLVGFGPVFPRKIFPQHLPRAAVDRQQHCRTAADEHVGHAVIGHVVEGSRAEYLVAGGYFPQHPARFAVEGHHGRIGVLKFGFPGSEDDVAYPVAVQVGDPGRRESVVPGQGH
jgi:hypothetical protein